jgi:hypothetical protein
MKSSTVMSVPSPQFAPLLSVYSTVTGSSLTSCGAEANRPSLTMYLPLGSNWPV